jgi:hypothetical protein
MTSKNTQEKPVVQCPHCNDFVIIEELNCKIFRHGIFIKDGKQLDPHLSKEMCNYFFSEKMIYGCGKPFRIIVFNNELKTEMCDYI